MKPNATGGMSREAMPKPPSTHEHTHASRRHSGMSNRSPRTTRMAFKMNLSIVYTLALLHMAVIINEECGAIRLLLGGCGKTLFGKRL